MSQKQKARKLHGRKDHWLPQGYMRGFIAPSRFGECKPLWCYDRHDDEWRCVSTKEIGHGVGFYDYASGTADYSPVTHPDSVFARLEREFPSKRDQMARNRFEDWENHKDFLLDYMQMLRARSPLAMEEQLAHARSLRGSTITSVAPDRRSVTVDSLELRPLPGPFVRNISITNMLADVKAGDWATAMDWCLRYTDDEKNPFCAMDQAVIVVGTVPVEQVSFELLRHPDTIVRFPLCWQACLFGSPLKFDKSYDVAHPIQLASIRNEQKEKCNRFVISPVRY